MKKLPRRMHTKSWAGRGLLHLLGHLPRVLSPPGWALYCFKLGVLCVPPQHKPHLPPFEMGFSNTAAPVGGFCCLPPVETTSGGGIFCEFYNDKYICAKS